MRMKLPLIPLRALVGVVLLTAFVCGEANAGEWLSLGDKVFLSDQILEYEIVFDQAIPDHWPNKSYDRRGYAFPDSLLRKALASASLVSTLANFEQPKEPPRLPERIWVFSVGSPCWWKAHEKGRLRTLGFYRKSNSGKPAGFFGVEHETGMFTDLNPAYPELLEAITQARSWTEERMRAVAPEMLWEGQREILRESKNPYLLALAVRFLEDHDAREAVDRAWGKAGTPEREAHEKLADDPHSRKGICLP